jgi:hypothetical protein
VIGWTARDFYETDIADTLKAFDGRIKDHIRQERIYRKLGHYAIAPHADKGFKIMKDWPIAMDEELNKHNGKITSERNLATLRRFKEEEAKRKLENGSSN